MSVVEKYDVLVCGGGLSGLHAASQLQAKGVDVILLEATDKLGGKALTAKNDRCQYGDLGWSYVGPTQNHIFHLAKQLGVHSYKVYNQGKKVFHSPERRELYDGSFPKIGNPFTALDFNNVTRELDGMAKLVPADAPWKSQYSKLWDRMTVKQFLEKIVWTEITREYINSLVRNLTSQEPHEVSLLWFLWVVSSAGGIRRLKNIDNGAYERKFEGGTQQICRLLGQRLRDRVRLNSMVGRIDWTDQGAHVTTHDGRNYYGKHIILSMPVPMQAKIIYRPALPRPRNQLMKRMESPATIRVLIYYTRPFWRYQGLSGVSHINDPLAPIDYTMDDTKPSENYPCLASYICGDKAREMAQYTTSMRQEKIAFYISKVFKTEEALHPVHFEEKVWVQDQLSGGVFLPGMKNGVLSDFGHSLRTKVGSLHMGSSDCATSWPGHMEGAVISGTRAANEVMLEMNVITEQEAEASLIVEEVIPAPEFYFTLYERYAPSLNGLVRGVTIYAVCYISWKVIKNSGVLNNSTST